MKCDFCSRDTDVRSMNIHEPEFDLLIFKGVNLCEDCIIKARLKSRVYPVYKDSIELPYKECGQEDKSISCKFREFGKMAVQGTLEGVRNNEN